MIDVQIFRSKILSLALSGNITKQSNSDEDARILAKEIRNKKGIKNELENIEDIPYDIPSNWCWVRVSDIGTLSSGKPYEELDSGLLYVKVGDMNLPGNEKTITTSQHFVSESNTGIIQVNSIIFPKRGGAIATNKKRSVINAPIFIDLNTMALTVDNAEIFPFVKLWFDSLDLAELQTGTSIPQINNKDIYPLLMPFPPLEEQKRIVDIVSKAFELLDEIDNIQSQYLSDLEVLKSKIIEAGIQGKLTEQLPEDGTAEELLKQIAGEKKQLIKEKKIKASKVLPEISEDEIPFEIPGNWKWIRLGNLIQIKSGDGLVRSDMVDGDIPVYGGNGISGYHNEWNVDKRTVVIGRVGVNCGSIHITEEKSWVTDNAFITMYPEKNVNQEYMAICLKYLELGKRQTATAQPVISGTKIYPIPFPLPPLAEQKRIAERINELLSVLDYE